MLNVKNIIISQSHKFKTASKYKKVIDIKINWVIIKGMKINLITLHHHHRHLYADGAW